MARKMKRGYTIALIVVVLLIVFRLLLPTIVLHYANNKLSHMHGYYGHVRDIDISLYRGAYQIKDIYINKMDSTTGKQTEFFKAVKIDLSIEWHALFNRRLVGELIFFQPTVIFTKDKVEVKHVVADKDDFRKILRDFMPLKVNRFEVNDGSIHYKDPNATPAVDIFLHKTFVLAHNLSNATRDRTKLPADMEASAEVYSGTLKMNMKLNPLANDAAFDLNLTMTGANLVALNDFFKAYGNFDVSKGTLGLYTEFAAENGKYKGYVKPIIKDLKVYGPQDRSKSFLQQAWEVIIGTAAKVLTNQRKDQIATKVEIEGRFHEEHTDVLEAIFQLLRNAFIQALMPSIDNEINLQSVETKQPEDKRNFLQRLFGKKHKDKQKDKDDSPNKKQ
ncbi:DUF748 domain-containing protein [Taibaiella soli]|uniref:DUF748 domain-containing protein n=1 Tax=Taibaiella soli TaxID=1649169 RepID=A0A2W2ATK1_9BACT|nr:DUF748 domain-containing protein [Taibaiella soli]PZF71274.1 hypothetical protein DN068_18420 [Taibaiella soli]